MKDNRVYLKVKLKSLAAEASIIREEERRARNNLRRARLAEHRRGVVRAAARNTHLAYAFLKGRNYRQIEENCRTNPDWKAVKAMVRKYGICYDDSESFNDYRKRQEEEAKRFDNWMKHESCN